MRVWTPWGALRFPAIDEPRELGGGGGGGVGKYSACLEILEPDAALDALLEEVGTLGLDRFGTMDFGLPVRVRPERGPNPWITASSRNRPERPPYADLSPGRTCRLLVEPFSFQFGGNMGVGLGLCAVEALPSTDPLEILADEAARAADGAVRLAQMARDASRMARVTR